MSNLPIIAGFGGINAAGRSSGHHAYRRLVLDALDRETALATRASLAALTGRLRKRDGNWCDGSGAVVGLEDYLERIAGELERDTLIRKLEGTLFDPDHLLYRRHARLDPVPGAKLEFHMERRQLPSPLPSGWSVRDVGDRVLVSLAEPLEVAFDCRRRSAVNSAGQLPTGFDPAGLYPSRNHPRALQLSVYAASDAINSLGVDWETLRQRVPPEQIGVYAGSSLGQLDYNGFGGLLQARLVGRKVTSKQLPLGFAEMPADFVNAYVLGNLGANGANVAACATFLYNLRQGVRDIQSGMHRVVMVGAAEAPLTPEVLDGFATMGALADDASLRALDGLDGEQEPDHRRACRPFGDNCGFTLAESAQFVVLLDDALALELGANVLGAVNEVFVNADGHKKSIAGPGLGNWLSMARAVAATRNVVGDDGLQRSFVQAHGTGTPQNRRTESEILSRVAATFGIRRWPVTAVKAQVGHSLATAAGDQLGATLGVWRHGIVPGIPTIDEVAEDVARERLEFLAAHQEVGATGIDAVLINSKGFGGNNASASILAPHVVRAMLEKRHGRARLKEYRRRNEAVRAQSVACDQAAIEGQNRVIYKFDHEVLGSESLEMDRDAIRIQGIKPVVSLAIANHYADMCEQG